MTVPAEANASKPIATLILNRNLPEDTDRLAEHLLKWGGDLTDVYVIESGSTPDRRSRHARFIADWPEAIEHGLRFPRGFNFGLMELEAVRRYDYYFLVCQDSVFPAEPTLEILLEEMQRHPLLGVLSPASPSWGETSLIPEGETRFLWFVNHIAWLYRRDLVDRIKNVENPTMLNYLYDGSNFRGYDTDIEVIAKAYANDMAVGVTRRAMFHEDETLTDRKAADMKTETRAINRALMYEEGMRWLRRKYGFNSRWCAITYVKAFYNRFFEIHPECARLRV
jgi:hypothetical protein